MDQSSFRLASSANYLGAGSLENETARRGEHAAIGAASRSARHLALSNRVPRDERAANAQRALKQPPPARRICQRGPADAQVRGQWREGERGVMRERVVLPVTGM